MYNVTEKLFFISYLTKISSPTTLLKTHTTTPLTTLSDDSRYCFLTTNIVYDFEFPYVVEILDMTRISSCDFYFYYYR